MKEMNIVKRCIFHVPNHINPKWNSASHQRPMKMINAFMSIGYIVDIVMGYGKIRKKQMDEIKKNIMKGMKYDFLYSESSTMPTLLTEKHHFPVFPFLDFGFMEFCRNHSIKVSLFYRDMHWNFKHYKKNVPLFKRFFSTLMYKYDLKKYRQLIDVLYVPSIREEKYLKKYGFERNLKTLPPGCDDPIVPPNFLKYQDKSFTDTRQIEIIYVGGIGGLYDLSNLFRVTKKFPSLNFNICVRERDWEQVQTEYANFLSSKNLNIVHVSGNELANLLVKADVAFTPLTQDEYYAMALPYKLFEYIGYSLPVIGQKGTAVGDFISDNECGWTCDENDEELSSLLQYIVDNPEEIIIKARNAYNAAINNRWIDRAKRVVNDLK